MPGVFDLIDPQALATQTTPLPGPSEFGRGLRSGGNAALGSLNNLAGAVAEQFGQNEFAQGRYAAADANMADAAAIAPRVGSYRDVHSLRDAGDYVAGLAGGMVPVGVPALAATALTGGAAIPAIAAGSAVMAPVEVGDVVGRQRAEGRPVSLRDAGVAGLVSAVGQNALPGLARASLAGRLRVPGGALAAIPEQAALSGGAEAVKQVGANPTAPLDQTSVLDAAAGGGVMGVPLAGMAAVGHGRQAAAAGVGKVKEVATELGGKAQDAATKVGDKAAELGGKAKDTAPQTGERVLEGYDSLDVPAKLREIFDQGRTAASNALDNVASGSEVMGDIRSFANATGEKLSAMLKADDDSRLGKAREWFDNLAKEKLDPEQVQRLQAAASDLGDRANQAVVAGMAKAREGYKTARNKVTQLFDTVKTRADELRSKDGTKKTEDDSGIQAAISEKIMPLVQKARPDLFEGSTRTEHTALINDLGRVLRHAVEDAASGKPFDSDTITKLIDITGGHTADLLDAVHSAVGETDKKRTASAFRSINAVADMEESHRGLMDLMRKSVPEGLPRPSDAQLNESMGVIKHWLTHNAQHPDDAQVKFKDRRTREMLKEQFGENADRVVAAVEKTLRKEENLLADESRDTSVRESDKPLEPGEEVRTDGERQYLFNKDGELYLNPEHDQGKNGKEPAATQAMRRAQAAHPDKAISFAPVSELGMEHPAVAKRLKALTDAFQDSGLSREEATAHAEEALKKYGVVSVEGTRQETAIGPHDLKALTIKRGYDDSPSILNTKGKNAEGNQRIDAVKLTEFMHRRLSGPDDWTEGDRKSGLHRKARMFMEGVTSLMEHTGHAFEVPDSTVIDKSGLTWGEVKNLHYSTEDRVGSEMPGVPELTRQLKKLREAFTKEAAKRNPDEDRLEQLKERGQKLAALLDSLNTDARLKSIAEDRGRHEPDPFGNVHEALGGKDRADAAIRTNQTGLPRADDLTNNQTPAAQSDPRANTGPIKKDAPQLSVVEGSYGKPLSVQETRKRVSSILRRITELLGDTPDSMMEHINAARAQYVNDRFDEGVGLKEARAEFTAAFGPDAGKAPPLPRASNDANGSAPDPKAVAAKKAAFLERARSGDEGLIKQLASSDDAKGLQRAAAALAGEKPTPEVLRITDAINKRLGELVRDEDTAYGMQTQRYSLQQPGNPFGRVDRLERQLVQNYIGKVLGPKIRVAWQGMNKLKTEGEFARVLDQQGGFEDVIRLSVHSLNPMSPAYHESMHAFIKRLGDVGRGDVVDTLMRAAEEPYVTQQIRDVMKQRGFSSDAIKQLADREERAAYMYQFWADGSLKLGQKSSTVLGKIADFVRSVLGVWSNDERALHILRYFHEGEFAKVESRSRLDERLYNDLMAPHRNKAIEAARKMTGGLADVGEALASAGGQRLRDTGVPALRELADILKLHTTGEGNDAGFMPAARAERTRVMNKLGADLKQYSKASMDAALESMQSKKDDAIAALATPEERLQAREVKKVVRKTLDAMHEYMTKAGVNVGDMGLGKDYFPRVYDTSYISKHPQAFKDVLARNGVKDADRVLQRIMVGEGAEFTIETDKPGMQHLKPRVLAHVPADQLAPFMRKDLLFTMQNYVTQATRRAEWARRLGDDGSKLQDLLSRAQGEGATPKDIDAARKYVRAIDGTLGDTINPETRRLMGNMIVYQNVRLLPLAIFSSVVDPMGIMVRGGTLHDAFAAFKRGVAEIPKGFKKNAQDDAATKLAADLGVIDDSALIHSLGALYSQGMVGDTGRKVNDTFFRLNLMEQFNTSMRVAATEAAVGFLKRHADGTASRHSTRWLAELGLQPGEVKLDANGRPDFTDPKIKMAINRWVDGAVLRPDAADKPIWMSDPHFALIAHLKQFTYSFHETILKRVMHEYQNGNYTPAMALASYVPIMIAADAAKGLIIGGGSQPSWQEQWGLSDYLEQGVERAGLYGVGQFAVDVFKDMRHGGSGIGALAGPTLEQLGDAVRVIGGREAFGHFALKAMPANALYASGEGDRVYRDD